MVRVKFQLEEKVIAVMRKESKNESARQLSALEIGERIVNTYPIDAQRKANESRIENLNIGNLAEQLRKEIYAHYRKYLKKYSELKVDESAKPIVFYYELKSEQGEENKEKAKTIISIEKPSAVEKEAVDIKEVEDEKALYSKLQDYMLNFSNCRVFSRYIAHQGKHPDGAGANEWLHPDLVGFQDMQEGVKNTETISLMEKLNHKRFIFWSFEVKQRLKKSDIRKSFFQAVANSSWANFAYLVAAEVENDETLEEIKILANLHGVGFIKLEKAMIYQKVEF